MSAPFMNSLMTIYSSTKVRLAHRYRGASRQNMNLAKVSLKQDQQFLARPQQYGSNVILPANPMFQRSTVITIL